MNVVIKYIHNRMNIDVFSSLDLLEKLLEE